ncbi:MAG: class I SAM-dependent methyltransferase [Gaiellaceae bacterium]
MSALDEILASQERAWDERPILRRLYRGWNNLIVSRLAHVDGPTVELGSGFGHLKEVLPQVVATDVQPTAWTNLVADAESLPFDDSSVANLILFDVFHHVARPANFLDEAKRVLVRGGRAVIFDPYCSPVSTMAYRRFHHERTDPHARPFENDEAVAATPMEANQARATLVFFRARDEFRRRWPELAIVEQRRLAFLVYPLSGGFSGRQVIPPALVRPVEAVERVLAALAPLLAFRCLVVLERVGGGDVA